MKLHGNAALSLKARQRMVAQVLEQDRSITEAALAAGVSDRTCSKWVARYRAEGAGGLLDRSSAPHHVHNRSEDHTVQTIAALRRLRFTGPEIADLLNRPLSTVSGILKRIGMGKLGRLGQEPVQRYERTVAGELIHIDVKKLGRIVGGSGKRINGGSSHYTGSYTDKAGRVHGKAGWDFVHIAIDDATRLAYAEVLGDEKAVTAVGFLRRAIKHFERYGMTVQELITDNGSPYISTVTRSPAAPWASATSAPGRGARRPTARPNASSARCSAAGPTARSTPQAKNAPPPLTDGSGTTTIADHTKPSADKPQPPA